MNRRIQSYQGLRFVFMTTIYLSHCFFFRYAPMTNEIFLKWFYNGVFGVGFFMMLSGTVITLGYGDRFETLKRQEIVTFLVRRMKKIYPLYVVSMLILFCYRLYEKPTLDSLVYQGKRFLLDLTMLQTLSVKRDIFQSLNGSAWFLSCIFVMYLLTPMLLWLNKKVVTSGKRIIIGIIAFIGIYLLCSVMFHRYNPEDAIVYLYYFPFVRGLYYVLGILVADGIKWLNQYTKFYDVSKGAATVLEVVAVILTGMCYFFRKEIFTNSISSDGYGLVLFLVVLLLFSLDKGWISKMLDSKPIQYLGGISFEFYLVHTTVFKICKPQIQHIIGNSSVKAGVCAVVLFVLFFVVAAGCQKVIVCFMESNVKKKLG